MNLNEYQQLAARTLIDEPDHEITQQQWDMVTAVHHLFRRANSISAVEHSSPGRWDMTAWDITGLLGEVGELVDVVKKDVFHQHPTHPDTYKKEIGDALWYWAACCTTAGYEAAAIAIYDSAANPFAYALARFYRSLLDFVEAFMPFTLQAAGAANIEKLKLRYPNGFDPGDSVKRVDVQ